MSTSHAEGPSRADLDFAIEIARAAGDRVMHLRETGRWEGGMLADIGDQAADGYLQGVIQGRYPEDGILSEETVDTPDRLEKHRCWIIDPLDGTKEFSQLRDDWGVHVALTFGGACGVGVVYLPTQDMLAWGVAPTVPWEGGGTPRDGDAREVPESADGESSGAAGNVVPWSPAAGAESGRGA